MNYPIHSPGKVRGPEVSPGRGPHAREPHGHVGPIDHIPVVGKHRQ